VPGVCYSETTLAFMARARFETPRQAIYGMKDPNIRFLIEHVQNEIDFPQTKWPPNMADCTAV